MDQITDHKHLKSGDFIRVSGTNGKVKEKMDFSGQVLISNEYIIEVKTFEYTIGFSLSDKEYKIEVYKLKKKPPGWDDFIKNPEKFKKPIEKAETVISKKDQIFNLVKNNPRKGVDSLLKIAKADIGGDINTLKSYIQLAKLKG